MRIQRVEPSRKFRGCGASNRRANYFDHPSRLYKARRPRKTRRLSIIFIFGKRARVPPLRAHQLFIPIITSRRRGIIRREIDSTMRFIPHCSPLLATCAGLQIKICIGLMQPSLNELETANEISDICTRNGEI